MGNTSGRQRLWRTGKSLWIPAWRDAAGWTTEMIICPFITLRQVLCGNLVGRNERICCFRRLLFRYGFGTAFEARLRMPWRVVCKLDKTPPNWVLRKGASSSEDHGCKYRSQWATSHVYLLHVESFQKQGPLSRNELRKQSNAPPCLKGARHCLNPLIPCLLSARRTAYFF